MNNIRINTRETFNFKGMEHYIGLDDRLKMWEDLMFAKIMRAREMIRNRYIHTIPYSIHERNNK